MNTRISTPPSLSSMRLCRDLFVTLNSFQGLEISWLFQMLKHHIFQQFRYYNTISRGEGEWVELWNADNFGMLS
jgi:hypothetical protein